MFLPNCAINIFYRPHLHLHFEIIELSGCKLALGRPGGYLKGRRHETAPPPPQSMKSTPTMSSTTSHEKPTPPISCSRGLHSKPKVLHSICGVWPPAAKAIFPPSHLQQTEELNTLHRLLITGFSAGCPSACTTRTNCSAVCVQAILQEQALH